MFPTEPIPETIGAYRVLRRLAGSGSARSYLARLEGPLGFQRTCALKLVPNAAGGDARLAQELAREATICAQLNHPAIVRMFDFFEQGDTLVLVLEHVEGASLDRLLQHLAKRRQKLGDPAAYHIAHRLAGALAHAHATRDEHGALTPVIHRNLHPGSILIGWDGQVRLTGFGMAKILGRTPDTVVGASRGAAGHMAPELLRGERPTTKTDVYGLGALLWSLLSGRKPPEKGRPASILSLRPDVPRPIATLIDGALTQFPEARTTTCQEIEETLAKVGHAEEGKDDLVLRIQSAHSSLELEETDVTDVRRPTLRVTAPSRPTLPPSSEPSAKVPAQDEPGPGAAQARKSAPGVPPTRDGRSAPGVPPTRDRRSAPEHAAPVAAPAPESIAPEELSLEEAFESEPTTSPSAGVVAPAADKASPERTLASAGLHPAPAPTPSGGVPPVVPRFGTPPPPPPGTLLPGIHFGLPPGSGAPPLDVYAVTPSGGVPPVSFGSPPAGPAPPLSPTIGQDATSLADAEMRFGRLPSTFAPHAPAPVRQILTLQATIAIAAAIVAVVVVVALYVAFRDPPSPVAGGGPAKRTASVAGGRPAPAPATTPESAPAPPVASEALPAGFGYLTVAFPAPGNVHVNGKLLGAVNEKLQVRCGRWFVRLARPSETRFPEWVSPGMTVTVLCQGSTTVAMKPTPGKL